MTYTDLGTSKGTKRFRGRQNRPANSSELLISLRKDFPRDTPQESRERFIRESELAVFHQEQSGFWYDLHRSKLIDPYKPKPAPPTPAEKAAREEEIQRQAEAITQEVRKEELLNMRIGEKKLRDMTREECTEMGGWLGRIAGKLRPGQKVGDALSEKQVAALKAKP